MPGHSDVVLRRQTVLVVDDDPAVRNSLQFYLEIEGFQVKAYSTSTELLAADAFPDDGCLIVDYRLPSMNGLDLIAELRRRGVMLPAILITTGPSASIRARASAAGVQLIEKPFINEALFEGIRTALNSGR